MEIARGASAEPDYHRLDDAAGGPELIEAAKDACFSRYRLSCSPPRVTRSRSSEPRSARMRFWASPSTTKSYVRNLLSLKSREREVEALNHQLTEGVLKRYLPPDLVDQIIAGDAALDQEPQTLNATILFSDLQGFTALSGKLRALSSRGS